MQDMDPENEMQDTANHTEVAQFLEEENEVVMEVTCQQDAEFLSEDSEDEEYQEEVMEMEDREFEDAMAETENNNASSDSAGNLAEETITEVPLAFRQLFKEGRENQKRQSAELADSRSEINTLKALIAKVEELLTGNKIFLYNPEFNMRPEKSDCNLQRGRSMNRPHNKQAKDQRDKGKDASPPISFS